MTQNFFIDGFSDSEVCVESPEDSISYCVGCLTIKETHLIYSLIVITKHRRLESP
jgi:hypothetical protein